MPSTKQIHNMQVIEEAIELDWLNEDEELETFWHPELGDVE